MKKHCLGIVFLTLPTLLPLAWGAPGDLLREVQHPDPQYYTVYGRAVGMGSESFVVGAMYQEIGFPNPIIGGAAYAFDLDSREVRLAMPNPDPSSISYDKFGFSVASSGSKIAIGSPGFDFGGIARLGAVFLYDHADVQWEQLIPNPAGVSAANDEFGKAVAIHGDLIFVGAKGAANGGKVYAFDLATGELVYSIPSPTPDASYFFGTSIDVSGDRLFVGARSMYVDHVKTEYVYMFEAMTGALVRSFQSPQPSSYHFFGWAVCAIGNRLYVAASGNVDGGVYIYDILTGDLLGKLQNPADEGVTRFGMSLARLGSDILVGSTSVGSGPFTPGAVYLFDGQTDELLHTFHPPVRGAGDQFGASVAASGGLILIGAPGTTRFGHDMCGTAYLFEAGFKNQLSLEMGLAGGIARLSWEGGAGMQLQRTSDLAADQWQNVQGSLGQSDWDVITAEEEAFFRCVRSE